MSPEQAEGKSAILDHRTDIYSLGITLYELLTLRPAFPAIDRQTLLRQIAEQEPVPPRHIKPEIPTDLETIVLKATSKHPADRYSSARELANDLSHFLKHEPIRARRATTLQRITRWSRRHRAIVVAAAAVLVITTALTTAAAALLALERDNTISALNDANRQRSRAENNLQIARQAVDDMYVQVAEKWLADEPRMEPLQREFLLKSLSFFELIIKEEGDTPNAQLAVGTALRRSGDVHFRLGDFQKSKVSYEEAIRRLKGCVKDDASVAAREELARACHGLAELVSEMFLPANYEDAIQLWRTLVDERPQETRFRAGLANSCLHFGRRLVYIIHDNKRAAKSFAEARGLAQDLIQRSPDEPRYYLLLSLAQSESASASDVDTEGVQFLEQSLETCAKALQLKPRNPTARNQECNIRRGYAGLLSRLGRTSEVSKQIEAAIESRQALVGEFPNVPLFQKELGVDYAQLVNLLPEDDASVRENLSLAARHSAAAYQTNADDIYCAVQLLNIYRQWADVCQKLGDYEARHAVREAAVKHVHGLLERFRGDRAWAIASQKFVWDLMSDHRLTDPQDAFDIALAVRDGIPPACKDFFDWQCLNVLAHASARLEKKRDASKYSRELIKALERRIPEEGNNPLLQVELAGVLVTCVDPELRDIPRAIQVLEQVRQARPDEKTGALFVLGLAHVRQGD
jgi:eukaryotic-like serine/threonine-protein kinase